MERCCELTGKRAGPARTNPVTAINHSMRHRQLGTA